MRFQRQLDFLRRQPEVGLLGSAMEVIDESGSSTGAYRQPETDSLIRFRLLLNNALIHTSVMVRRELLVTHRLQYDSRYAHVEDYELWTRVLQVTKAHNLQEPLVRYSAHDGSVSQQKRVEQAWRANHVSDLQIRHLDPTLRISREAKSIMLNVLTKYLWFRAGPGPDREWRVLPDLHRMAVAAVQRFPAADRLLREFAMHISDHIGSASPGVR
jgi:hypothetical protein